MKLETVKSLLYFYFKQKQKKKLATYPALLDRWMQLDTFQETLPACMG